MPEFHPVSPHRSEWGLFSADELRKLMEIEFQRAKRYGYDLACLCIAVDRLGHLQDLYGTDSKAQIQDALHEIMKRVTRDSDFPRGMVDDALLALFPQTSPDGAVTLAQRLLKASRMLKIESDGRALSITLSIGVAGNGDKGASDFESMSQQAQASMALARAAGGARWMRAEQATSELDQLRRELDDLRSSLERQGAVLDEAHQVDEALARGSAPGGELALSERPEDQQLADRLSALFAAAGGLAGPDAQRLQQELIATALRGVHEERKRDIDRKLAENEDELDTLRRRVTKLNDALTLTEEELRRVMALKNIDPGVASIFRTVQGLSADAANTKERLDMLSEIFEHNLELRQRLKSGGP